MESLAWPHIDPQYHKHSIYIIFKLVSSGNTGSLLAILVSSGNTGFQSSQTDIRVNKYWPSGMLGPAMLEVRSFSFNSGHMNIWPSQAGVLSF